MDLDAPPLESSRRLKRRRPGCFTTFTSPVITDDWVLLLLFKSGFSIP
jgi:hypothetical protein